MLRFGIRFVISLRAGSFPSLLSLRVVMRLPRGDFSMEVMA
jgi:hypothetical protein